MASFQVFLVQNGCLNRNQRQITSEGSRTRKNSAKDIDLIWPQLTSVDLRRTRWHVKCMSNTWYYMSTFISISLAKTTMFANYVPQNAFFAWHNPSYDVLGQMLTRALLGLWISHRLLGGGGGGGRLNARPWSRLLVAVEKNERQRSKAREKSFRNHFGRFWLRSKLGSPGVEIQKFSKTVFRQ